MAALAPIEQSLGAPGDVFSTDVPVLGGDSPESRAIAAGDTGVSTQTGAFQYRYPIEVPPGRLGVQPSLAFHYSSQGSIHGGIAAGWSLDLPEIRIDSRQSRLALQDPFVEEMYESSLAGGHRLIRVSEPAAADVQTTFRAQNDPSYSRYERLINFNTWRVRTQDGTTHFFGESDHVGIVDPTRFLLTRTQDEYGNTVHYFWQPIQDGTALVDHVLQRIEYTTNAAAGLAAHARVFFDYAVPPSCGVGSNFPVGALLDQRAGLRYRGSRQLTSIRTEARSGAGFRPVRTIALTYSDEADDCGRNHGPLRILTGIQETARAPDGTTTTKPAVTFGYGPLERNLNTIRTFISNDDPSPGIHAGRRRPFSVPNQAWPSLDSTLVDIDGDGRSDRLRSEGCTARWSRNSGDRFSFAGDLELPTFRAADLSDCSLAGQFTVYSNTFPPQNPIYCLPSVQTNKGAYLAYRFLDMNGDGLPELVAALHYHETCYDPLADQEAVSRWNLGPCEAPNPADRRRPLESCNGFPWEIYWNLGGGTFDMENPTVVHQPVPLESDAGDSSLGGGRSTRSMGIMSAGHSIIDIDGDGYLDGVRVDSDSPSHWQVFRGDGSGQFWPRSDSFPYLWTRPDGAPMVRSTTSVGGPHIGGKWRGHVRGQSAFVDMNADGIMDLLWTETPLSPETFAYLGTGTGFRTGTTSDPINRKIPLGTPSVRYSRAVGTEIQLRAGTRSAWRFPFDYDQDGRVDFYLKDQTEEGDPPQTETELRFGDGSGAQTPAGALSATEITRIPQILEALPDDEGRWTVASDFLDIDGDGVSEFVELEGDDLRLYQDQRNGLPMRLLNRIENGAGGRIDIRYRPSTDRQIDIAGTDDRLGMPYHTWLVELVSTSGLTDQNGATQYRYGRPIWNRDDRGRWGFRGFDRVQETLPAGSVVEYRHDYALDWSGRLVERAIYDDPDPGPGGLQIDSIESTTWQRLTLFAGSVSSFQIVDRKTRTCSGTQTYEQCQLAGALQVESTTWQAQTSYWDEDGPALLHAPTSVWRKRGDTIANGDRRFRKRYFVFSRSDRYRLRPLNELTDERQDGADMRRAQTEFDYDIEGKTWQMATRYNSDGTHETEYTWIELPSGQVTGRRKPQQFANTTTRSHISYDADQLYPAQTRNELNHVIHTAYDLGTGALLSTRGPNSRPCGASCTEWEETRTEIDGFGRPLRVFVNVENAETGRYESKLIERFSYFDAEQPQRVRHERQLEFELDDWMVTDTTFDGFGRVRSRVEFRFWSGRPDATYTFGYDGAGRLVSLTAPDPSQDNGATVVYSYDYNSLGEVRRVERPEGSALVWARDGLRTTRTEEAASGPLAETTNVRDVFGRLVQVDERLDGGGVATTTYAHDALDNVRRVTSPDGVVTDLQHDSLGRRRRITRGSRVWRYDYDLNGNLVREIAPVPAGASEAAYTSSTVYDDLDRPTSHLAGVRALSPAEQTAINHGLITYTYDAGQGGIGRLAAVASRDSVWTRAYSYDARGNAISETLSFDLEPALGVPIADSREQHRIFLALAPFGLENVGDGLDQGTSTQIVTLPDRRGRAAAVLLPNPTRFVAFASYNAAGVVDGIDGGGVDQVFTRDNLGRVTGMEVRSNTASPELQASETFTYFGTDDPQTLTTFRQGLGTHRFDFDYDRRHQLTGATSDRGYDALFTYTAGGRLATAFVDSPNGAPLAPPRDVIYEYTASDPEAVSRLAAGEADETFIAYGHDVSGNVVARTHAAGESFSFLYDGDDTQRRAVAADGSSEFYYYDHANRRILTVTRRPDGAVDKVRLVFGKLEVEYGGDGSVTRTVAHLTLDRPVGRVVNRGAEERVIHGQLGNLLAAFTPDASSLSTAFVYGPFGETLAELGETDSYIHRFNGKEQDELTDLSYYGYRYFDPYSLTWTQADPLYRFAPDLAWDEPRRMNLYAFSLNNPLRYLDPDGKNPGRPPGPWAGPGIQVPPVLVNAVETTEVIAKAAPVGMEVGGDALSLVPVVGIVGDVISAAGSALQGNEEDAAISAGAIFTPGVGSAEAKGIKAIIEEAAEALGKHGDDAAKTTKRGSSGTRASRDTMAGHRKNKRESNREKHERGDERRGRDQGGEGGDARRRPHRKPPPGHKGPWPPKPKQGNVSDDNASMEQDEGRATFD